MFKFGENPKNLPTVRIVSKDIKGKTKSLGKIYTINYCNFKSDCEKFHDCKVSYCPYMEKETFDVPNRSKKFHDYLKKYKIFQLFGINSEYIEQKLISQNQELSEKELKKILSKIDIDIMRFFSYYNDKEKIKERIEEITSKSSFEIKDNNYALLDFQLKYKVKEMGLGVNVSNTIKLYLNHLIKKYSNKNNLGLEVYIKELEKEKIKIIDKVGDKAIINLSFITFYLSRHQNKSYQNLKDFNLNRFEKHGLLREYNTKYFANNSNLNNKDFNYIARGYLERPDFLYLVNELSGSNLKQIEKSIVSLINLESEMPKSNIFKLTKYEDLEDLSTVERMKEDLYPGYFKDNINKNLTSIFKEEIKKFSIENNIDLNYDLENKEENKKTTSYEDLNNIIM